MTDWLILLNVFLASIAGLFAFLAFWRAGRSVGADLTQSNIPELLRTESDRIRHSSEEQARGLRQELSTNLRGFQETTLKAFRELGEALSIQVKEFGNRLDVGVKAIDDRVVGIGSKLDQDIVKMGTDANLNRDTLRQAIESKLDDASSKQAVAAKDSREEITGSFRKLGVSVTETLDRLSGQQKERLENVIVAIGTLTDKQEKAQEALKQTVEGRLDAIRISNEVKLEEMRKTVDEKLQSTLESRIGQSFQLVSDQLQKVSSGLGEMQQLASGVGDLKRVLTQVRPRGIWGEAQLGSLLEDFLAPDQFARNICLNPGTQERVEFAIRLPRLTDAHGEVLLPIDAKFPHDSFERIVAAAEQGDGAVVEESARALERAIRIQAKDIKDKYIMPPGTTDYAVMYLPSEALYAEVARRPGLIEALTREYSVMIAGPSTLTALLNAIRVGFRSALIHRQAGEISSLLQKVQSEFEKYGRAIQTVYSRATSTVTAIEKLQTRQNVMGRALRGVNLLSADSPIDAATKLIDLETSEMDTEENDGDAEHID